MALSANSFCQLCQPESLARENAGVVATDNFAHTTAVGRRSGECARKFIFPDLPKLSPLNEHMPQLGKASAGSLPNCPYRDRRISRLTGLPKSPLC